MAAYFLDTSALAKLYIQEDGTEPMIRLLTAPGSHQFGILTITRVEFRSALRQRQRARELDAGEAARVLTQFDEHLTSVFVMQPVTETVLDHACLLIDAYGLRTYDAVQLAGCRTLIGISKEPVCFVCSDGQLLAAAAAEGIETFDPVRE